MAAFENTSWTVVERGVTSIHDLVSLLRGAFVEAREMRVRLEADLFHNQYRLSSKNDDDLPIIR